MHIIVLVKQVPESEELRYDPDTRTLMREGVKLEINPYDKRALTEALRLRSLYGGSVTAVTMGPPQAREALVECLGRGVDRAIHISDRALAGSDTLATARTLVALLRRLNFDLVLAGKYSTDSETGQVGPELALLLGIPQVTGATAIDLVEGEALRVNRETDWGFEEILCPLPALLTAAERLIKPVKTKPELIAEGERRVFENPSLIETLTIYDLGLAAREVGLVGSPTWVVELRPVEIERQRIVLSGDPLSSAESVLLALAERRGASGDRARSLPPPSKPTAGGRDVWAVAEWTPARSDKSPVLRPVSLELVSQAAALASGMEGEAGAVLLGHSVEGFVPDLAQHGASVVFLADAPELSPYTAETYSWVLARQIERRKPWAVLLPATSFGSDLAPRVAAQLGLGLTGDCVGLEIDHAGRLLQLKPAFGGQVIAPIASRTLPSMATVRPGALPAYRPDPDRSARVVPLDISGMPVARARVLSTAHEEDAGLALDTAKLVVSVGTGTGGPEALEEIERLAAALGAWLGIPAGEVAIGGTRKAVDAGWLPRQQQIGTTGRMVSPDVYLALGIQGKFNHTVGILGSGTIVSVNNDPGAPIFGLSDIGVVGDWREFARAMLAAIEKSDKTTLAWGLPGSSVSTPERLGKWPIFKQ